jgi:phage gp37-like protein
MPNLASGPNGLRSGIIRLGCLSVQRDWLPSAVPRPGDWGHPWSLTVKFPPLSADVTHRRSVIVLQERRVAVLHDRQEAGQVDAEASVLELLDKRWQRSWGLSFRRATSDRWRIWKDS